MNVMDIFYRSGGDRTPLGLYIAVTNCNLIKVKAIKLSKPIDTLMMPVIVPHLALHHVDAVPARPGWLRKPLAWVLLWAVWCLLWLGYYAQHEAFNLWMCRATP